MDVVATSQLDHNGLEVMDRQACVQRLARGGVGRLGLFAPDGWIHILPVTFWMEDETVFMHTRPGGMIQRVAEAGVPVAFEVDDTDPGYRGGRSVLVRGRLHLAHSALPGRHPQPWGARAADVLVALTPEHITGRRIPWNSAPA